MAGRVPCVFDEKAFCVVVPANPVYYGVVGNDECATFKDDLPDY